MSLSVNASAIRPITCQPTRTPIAEGHAFRSLAQSLRAGDVDAAKAAYVDVIKYAPEGAKLERGSPFAQIGKALHQGDVDAAKVAFADMVKGAREQLPPVVTLPPMPVPATSSTGGIAGSTLNEVA